MLLRPGGEEEERRLRLLARARGLAVIDLGLSVRGEELRERAEQLAGVALIAMAGVLLVLKLSARF